MEKNLQIYCRFFMLQKRIPFFIAAGGLSLQSYGVFLSDIPLLSF